MNPISVQVEEISELVNEPVATSWWWRHKESVVTSIPTPTRLVVETVPARTRLVLFSKRWMRRTEESVDEGKTQEAAGKAQVEKKVLGWWERTKLFITELWGKVFGV